MTTPTTAEHERLSISRGRQADWKHWGPYVSERAWGTVREDYSDGGAAWDYFTHDQARSRTFRWNEDGLAGISDRQQLLCLALGLWNGHDPILKERMFGLGGPEGNHGEDVKEYYFYLDSTPTHSYMKMLYKYPQAEFPYAWLAEENRRRGRDTTEFELVDTGVFNDNRYFDVFVEYAKAGQEDILCRITAINRGPDPAEIHVLPHLWYRNTWSWWLAGFEHQVMRAEDDRTIFAPHPRLGDRWLYVDEALVGPAGASPTPISSAPTLLFTENETNSERLFGSPNRTPFVKDGINDAVVHGRMEKVNPERRGTKAAAHYQAVVAPGEALVARCRLTDGPNSTPFADFDKVFDQRLREADEFYATIQPARLTDDERNVQRQAFAGLMWSKQFFHYSVKHWLEGDPAMPPPPESRRTGRNHEWSHVFNLDVLSMPDKWEYPWFAAWDLAFHTLPLAQIDPEFAKRQLILMLREWYMHPNGQIPAYEWAFSDVNPPVHAWAAWRVYKIDRNLTGKADLRFLERIFHKLMLNFTWWVNRKDAEGNNIFQGGFLGLDNIGVFDRSAPLPTGGYIEQADGTAWMGMYCLNLLAIALELARNNSAYEDVATKFFEHFMYIADAINHIGGGGESLWDEEDGFFYDQLHLPDGSRERLKVRSMVGLIPLFAVETLEPDLLEKLPRFRRRMQWFIENRPDLVKSVASLVEPGEDGRRLLSLIDRNKLSQIMPKMFDSGQFLSPYGLRALSKGHEENPYLFRVDGHVLSVRYEPAESSTGLFGGNSNWRGPIWFPVNYLMIESLQKFDHYYGDTFRVEVPLHSGNWMTLAEAAADLSRRLNAIFLRDDRGRRPVFGGVEMFQNDPHWRDYVPFYEYFHGDNGAGIGASHQTGWTALAAKTITQSGGGESKR